MNRFELECVDFINDALTNRPREMNGENVKYNEQDRKKLREIIISQKQELLKTAKK